MGFLIPDNAQKRKHYKEFVTEIQFKFGFLVILSIAVILYYQFGPTTDVGFTIPGLDINTAELVATSASTSTTTTSIVPDWLHSTAIHIAVAAALGWYGCEYYWEKLDRADRNAVGS